MPYYYRGTTRGWRGSSNSVEQEITFASTDPLVATLFAIECRNHGRAAVLIVTDQTFPVLDSNQSPGRINPVDITFTAPESAVQLLASPSDVEAGARFIIGVDEAIEFLEELGFREIPIRIAGKEMLQDILFENHARGVKLSLRQIREFDRRIEERSP